MHGGQSGGIGIVAHHDLTCIAAQQFHLLRSQTRTQGSHQVRHPLLERNDKIHIPFHQDGVSQFLDRFLGKAQAIEIPTLIIEPGLGRIQILRRPPVHGPRTESDRPPLDVGDGKHDPAAKTVVDPGAILRPLRQPAIHQRLKRKALFLQKRDQVVPPGRGVAEAEATDGLLRNTPIGQVAEGALPLLGVPQAVVVGGHGFGHGLAQDVGV